MSHKHILNIYVKQNEIVVFCSFLTFFLRFSLLFYAFSRTENALCFFTNALKDSGTEKKNTKYTFEKKCANITYLNKEIKFDFYQPLICLDKYFQLINLDSTQFVQILF